jgi:prepilin-type processing-associated H-X9-DG protein
MGKSLRHRQGGNALFCDWHVEWLNMGDMEPHSPGATATGIWSVTAGD